jgi:hypothetical protein
MSAEEIRTVDTKDGDVVYDSDMPIKSLKSVMGAGKTGDLDDIIKGFKDFIVSWPYEGDPTDPEAWDELRRSQFNNVVTGVMEDLGELGNE